ncbi:hypothetical protein HNR46_002747 [Haloferula luteola]|uniref:Uncharacterized protein n=1 Tax=Haloferula luteola TaxID=595692 RepID=A0A840VIH2_9BACT|nr:hypothetical protein [Haloferula luteola]MBB5352501.1 hypothetical protein [Haloferula luteola]
MIAPCPFLPAARGNLSYRELRAFGERRDAEFYLAALTYAQCLWQRGLPAQAILPLDRAWGAELRGDEPILHLWPAPYAALIWMLENRPQGPFLGNPVRHFQHLATRVRGTRREIRSWRAWACFHLAEKALPSSEFPRDFHQIQRDSLTIPSPAHVRQNLAELGWPGEAAWLDAHHPSV